jgi:Flp pilus assembly protein TadG
MRKFWSQIRNRVRDESGVSLVLVALSLSVMLGMAALAVDTGMLLTART